VSKEYVAIVHGIPDPPSGRLETLIGRSKVDRKKMSVEPVSAGRVAITNYEVAEKAGDYCVVRVRIETGRTHQIRVHMAHIGHPVAGDRQYGGRKAAVQDDAYPSRQMLHAEMLAFNHPGTNKRVTFKAPLPEDMRKFLRQLRAV
jgi:23S rRNA pseudouridine1911/1915/1917 synthase